MVGPPPVFSNPAAPGVGGVKEAIVDAAREATGPEGCCEQCGAAALRWRSCKLVCGHCGTINKSCADL